MVRNVLIKASGDLVDNEVVFDFAREKAKNNYTVFICGAGTKIGKAFEERGYGVKYNEHGRINETFEGRKIARDILENEQGRLQNKFIGTGVEVEIPLINMGSVLCHLNGDAYVKAGYLGFDEIYVFTLKDRVDGKKKIFEDYSKVKIIGV